MAQNLANSIDLNKDDYILCNFCNKHRYARLVNGFFVGYEPCDCIGAQAEAEREKQEEQARQEEKRRKEYNAMCQRANIKTRYRHAKTEEANNLANIVLDDKKNVYISGKVGSGKTYLASAIALSLLKNSMKQRVFFAEVYELIDAITKTYSLSDAEGWVFIDRMTKADCLVIDDLGKENYTEHTLSKVYQLINERYINMRPTIITSNYALSELGQKMSEKTENDTTARSILSRIADNCEFVTLKGSDRRLREAM